jgi:dihydrofolate reductase
LWEEAYAGSYVQEHSLLHFEVNLQMAKLNSFTMISLNGYYKDDKNAIAWHKHGEEELEYSRESLKPNNILVSGRITYEEMVSFWPIPMGVQTDPIVAKGMNDAEKIVISKTLTKADWNNTRIVNRNIIEEIGQLKQNSQKDITILGSGSIVTFFSEHNLIDEYQIMLDPVALGSGSTIFANVSKNLELTLEDVKPFKSGVVLLTYFPFKKT